MGMEYLRTPNRQSNLKSDFFFSGKNTFSVHAFRACLSPGIVVSVFARFNIGIFHYVDIKYIQIDGFNMSLS